MFPSYRILFFLTRFNFARDSQQHGSAGELSVYWRDGICAQHYCEGTGILRFEAVRLSRCLIVFTSGCGPSSRIDNLAIRNVDEREGHSEATAAFIDTEFSDNSGCTVKALKSTSSWKK